MDFEPGDSEGHHHSQPSDVSSILSLIFRGRKTEYEGLFDDRTFRGGEDEPDTYPLFEAPSTLRIHPSSLCFGARRVNLVMKSARTYPLITVPGSYLMPYRFNSAAHFAIRPVASGFTMMFHQHGNRKGLEVVSQLS